MVDVPTARISCETWYARACEFVDTIMASTVVRTRIRRAIIYVIFAVDTIKSIVALAVVAVNLVDTP